MASGRILSWGCPQRPWSSPQDAAGDVGGVSRPRAGSRGCAALVRGGRPRAPPRTQMRIGNHGHARQLNTVLTVTTRELSRLRCALCDQRPDPICRARSHVGWRTPAACCTAGCNGLSQTRGHRPAAVACGDVPFDCPAPGGRQLAVEISRQLQQQLAATDRRASLDGHFPPSWRAA